MSAWGIAAQWVPIVIAVISAGFAALAYLRQRRNDRLDAAQVVVDLVNTDLIDVIGLLTLRVRNRGRRSVSINGYTVGILGHEPRTLVMVGAQDFSMLMNRAEPGRTLAPNSTVTAAKVELNPGGVDLISINPGAIAVTLFEKSWALTETRVELISGAGSHEVPPNPAFEKLVIQSLHALELAHSESGLTRAQFANIFRGLPPSSPPLTEPRAH